MVEVALEYSFIGTIFPQEPAGDSTLCWNMAELKDSRHLGTSTRGSLRAEVGVQVGKSNMGQAEVWVLLK